MNILIITSASNRSGGARQALYLAQGLAERGHAVTFFIPQNSPLPELAPQFTGFVRLGKKNTWRASLEAAMPKDGTPCVVHAFHNAAVKKAAWWGLLWWKKAVVVAHRGVLFRPKNPLPYWSPGIARFVVNSEICASVLRGIGLSAKRLRVVPNAVPDERVTPKLPRDEARRSMGIGPDNFLFGCIANNNPVKGINQLITAFAKYVAIKPKFSHARLAIIGINPALWEPLCREMSVLDKVMLIPPTEDVASLLGGMDTFVLPSLSESMPNTLLEAVRMGLPCIGTKVGAVPDIIDTCGICVEAGDVASLGAAMVRMLHDSPLRIRFKVAAVEQAQHYSPAARLQALEAIYTEALHQRGLA